jgi:hypothetical protein
MRRLGRVVGNPGIPGFSISKNGAARKSYHGSKGFFEALSYAVICALTDAFI